MRSVVLSSRIRHLMKVSSLGVLGIAIAGCSSGFQRFDRSVYTEAVPQHASQNPYPGDVDYTTTASTQGNGQRFAPLQPVAPQAVPQGVYHQAEPGYAARQPLPTYQSSANQYKTAPAYNTPVGYPAYRPASSYQASSTYKPANTYKPASTYQSASAYQAPRSSEWGNSGVTSSKLSKPVSYTPPKPDTNKVYIPEAKTDSTTTASVKAPASREAGWTSTGGTRITIRQGETLYNLSKRYGVPVKAIREANGFSSTDTLKSGQQITIPNYVFSQQAAVSAPDNDPKTRAASAGTGYLGEAKDEAVRVPEKRPAESSATQYTYIEPQPELSENNTGGVYVVQPGDNLSKIAARNGTTVAALQRANGLSGTSIRIGQKLSLTGSIDPTTTASVQKVPEGVDPIVTGSLKQPESKPVEEETAPARTGISEFRWPVKGRVVSKFGERSSSGKNEGIDISVPEGTAVRAAENGVVIYVGDEISAYGKLILVRHDDDWVSAYAHNRDFEVAKGDKVRRGQIIARSGKTGKADRPKLHFELRKASKAVDPKKYLAGA